MNPPMPPGLWLNVGSGPADPEPWINLDASWQALVSRLPSFVGTFGSRILGRDIGRWPRRVRYCDVRKGLPFGDGSVAVLYASHVLEHLYRGQARRFLSDAHRVLEPGGVLRVVVPDAHAIVVWYLQHAQQAANGKASSDLLMDMLQLRPRDAPRPGLLRSVVRRDPIHLHKWMYDAVGLAALVSEAGFGNVEHKGFLDSAIPRAALTLVEHESRVCDGAGVCVEARK